MGATKKSVRRMLRRFSEVNSNYDVYELFKLYCDIRRADSYAHATNYQGNLELTNDIEAVFDEIVKEEEAFSISDLAINGNDLLEMKIPKGPDFSRILNACLDVVIDGKIPNEKQALLDFVKNSCI